MSTTRWQRIQDLFHRAAELDETARRAFLDEACADDEALREEVESLVATASEMTVFFGASQSAAETGGPERDTRIGERVGPYRLVRRLGAGGMGVVYLGERVDGEFERKVAVKLVRAPWLAPQMLERFRAERQILAQLEHPNIARLLDGGTTRLGQPYLVMEYVEGEPINDYCARHRLSTRRRLKLFLDVCAAIAHAHRQLVVHRDLKPANVLVTGDGQRETIKLLDFGIAKLLVPDASTVTLTAGHGQLLTPQYASPEQVRGEPVSTASDVYSLGVLLYEFLADVPPYRLEATTPQEIERTVCETLPQRPSATVASARRHRELAGDLDTIVMTALRKTPGNRYASVERLADDLRRHLDGFPITARPASRTYRLGKFLRRHALATGAAGAVVLALVAGTTATTLGMLEARRQSDLAENRRQALEQVAGFQQAMLAELDPQLMGASILGGLQRQYREATGAAQPPTLSGSDPFDIVAARANPTDLAREIIDEVILDRAVATIERDFADQPLLQADLYDSVFDVYNAIGLTVPLPALSERIVELRTAHLGADATDTLLARAKTAAAYRANGRLEDAEAVLLAVIAEAGEQPSPALQRANGLLVGTWTAMGRTEEAAELARRHRDHVLAYSDDRLEQAGAIALVGYVAARSARMEEALAPFRAAAEHVRASHGEENPSFIRHLSNVAAALGALQRIEESLQINEQLLAILESAYGKRHPQTLRVMGNKAANLLDLGLHAEAAELLEQAVAQRTEVFGAADPMTLRSMLNLAATYHHLGQGERALALIDSVVEQRTALLGAEHPDTLNARWQQADTLHRLGQDEEALELATQVRRASAKTFNEHHPYVQRADQLLADIHNKTGAFSAAEAIATRLLEVQLEHSDPAAPATLLAAWAKYRALDGLGDNTGAAEIREVYLDPLLDADPERLDATSLRIREEVTSM